ncbi:hypothetical protein [Nitrospira sp. Nam80]
MNDSRQSRLAVRPCPGCARETLVSNGAFWACAGCRYAVTSMALAMDRAAPERLLRGREKFPPHAVPTAGFDEAELETETASTAR